MGNKQTRRQLIILLIKNIILQTQIFTMEAVNKCSEVLEYIRQSKLNFVFSESPFGVQISVKKSFRKHIEARSSENNNINVVLDQTDQIEILEKLNKKLEREMLNAETSIKDLKQKSELFRKESKDYCVDIETHILNEKRLQKHIKEREKEIYDIKKELTQVAEHHRDAIKEITELKVKVNQEKKEKVKLIKKEQKKDQENLRKDASCQTDNFECGICSIILQSKISLSDHMKNNHKESVEASSQTAVKFGVKCQQTDKISLNIESFEKYPCFYCGRMIVSANDVSEHFRNCRGWKRKKHLSS